MRRAAPMSRNPANQAWNISVVKIVGTAASTHVNHGWQSVNYGSQVVGHSTGHERLLGGSVEHPRIFSCRLGDRDAATGNGP